MALKFPDRLESNNPAAYGVVKANQVSGHKTVNTVENLYTLADAILSDSGTGNDAIGQRWYVVSENCYYELVNWTNRKISAGWVKIYTDLDIQTKLDTKVDKVLGKSLVEDTEINKLKELPNKSTLDSQIADAKQAGTSAQDNLTSHINNTENPHNVTKTQVGLGNVDNTSDINKPISTATQEALNTKMNIAAQKLVDEDLDVILNYGFYYGGGDNTVVHKPAGVDAFSLHVYLTASGFKALELTEGNLNPGAIYWRLHDSLQWSPWIPKAGVFLSNPVNNQVLVSDTTGRLKSSGYTIASSVPANAKFTDTIYDDTIVKQDITNLKTNKLDSSAYTALDVLNKLKTVDGAESGLEADTVRWDGVQEKPEYATRWPSSMEVGFPTLGEIVTDNIPMGILPFINNAGTNVFAGMKPGIELKIERSTDNGIQWTDVTNIENTTDYAKLFSGVVESEISICSGSEAVVGHQLRITIDPKNRERYCRLAFMYIGFSTNGTKTLLDIEENTRDAKDVWNKIISDIVLGGWSGANIIGLDRQLFGQPNFPYSKWGLRITFKSVLLNSNPEHRLSPLVYSIRAFSDQKPLGDCNNPIFQNNAPYNILDEDLTTNFPGILQCKNQEVYHKGNLTLDKLDGVAKKATVATNVEWAVIE